MEKTDAIDMNPFQLRTSKKNIGTQETESKDVQKTSKKKYEQILEKKNISSIRKLTKKEREMQHKRLQELNEIYVFLTSFEQELIIDVNLER